MSSTAVIAADGLESMDLDLGASLWLTLGKTKFAGMRQIELLLKIDQCGSISQAAKAIKMSYKAAWDAVESMNNLTGEPLVLRFAGGKGGGGAVLTERAKALVKNFSLIAELQHKLLLQVKQSLNNPQEELLLMQRMLVKTSARNQFFGTVEKITVGAVNNEVILQTDSKQKIVANITKASCENLGLAEGVQAFALVKASMVIVLEGQPNYKISTRNTLFGKVSAVQKGAVNSEVTISFADGGSIVAIITNPSLANLQLEVGSQACAAFKASSVIMGTVI